MLTQSSKVGRPRQSNASTPAPGEPEGSTLTLADKLSYADTPRPFRNPHFVSHLHTRTASSSTTGVKKNVKQILILERERVSGGDGFLTAAQCAQRARGEPIEVGKKKKGDSAAGGGAGVGGASGSGSASASGSGGKGGGRRGNIQNLLRGRLKQGQLAVPGGYGSGLGAGSTASGISTPLETEMGSGTSTPAVDEDGEGSGAEDGAEGGVPSGGRGVNGMGGAGGGEGALGEGSGSGGGTPRQEVFTYHTPAAPPSLLPAKKYCDITGLHASYTDPRTKLRYKGLEVWHVVRGLGPGGDQAYLALRGAQTSLK